MSTEPVPEFIAALPKAELHVHLVGSASVQTVLELSRRHPDRGVPTEQEALRVFYDFTDFAHFIDVYIAVNSLVRSPDDVRALTVGVARDLASQNVRYAELTVTPDSHLLMGIGPEALAEALTAARGEARRDHGIELGWIFDIPGELGLASGERTIDWVAEHAPEGSVGFGLGGPEVGVPRPQFADVFARARALGLHSVPHAGETTGPQTIWDALLILGAERIGHGIAAVQDEALLTYLVEHRVALEVCPTSNLRTHAVTDLASHPFLTLREAGVPVTLNSDDPGMFASTLNDEYAVASRVFGLSDCELGDLVRTAIDVSFAPEPTKATLRTDLDSYLESR